MNLNLLSFTMFFPLLGFFLLAISRGKFSKCVSAIIGVGSIAVSFIITLYIVIYWYYFLDHCIEYTYIQKLWTWFSIFDLCVVIALRLDELSLTMLLVIVGVGFIIHIYAAWYMQRFEGYSRFFAYTNLFMFNMILLVLSDDLLLMYFGWEGVGLCSYLLIGFYYSDINNGIAAIKSFIITRFGDICLIFALCMIYIQYHTFSFSELLQLDPQFYIQNSEYNIIWWISFMLFIGSISKSAQIPFQSWLISAMVGPTPISALIHAATMVTSGVYLINRMKNFFLMTPDILYFISFVGAITLILFSCSAIFQSDIKKILAYSTISQIGYMFLAIGRSEMIASVFHLVTHAFFKGLLFLSAGSLIYVCHHERNIFKMGGLYKSCPIIYIGFLIGGASLSAFPLITIGFYSKEMIISNILMHHDYCLWILGLIGVLLTSIYIFRMIFIVFHGIQKIEPLRYSISLYQNIPLFFLIILSTFLGRYIPFPIFNSIAEPNIYFDQYMYVYSSLVSGILVVFGIWIASIFWLNKIYLYRFNKNLEQGWVKTFFKYSIKLCYYGWGFDRLYEIIFVKPYFFITNRFFNYDWISIIIYKITSYVYWILYQLRYVENRSLNWYITSINIGAIFILTFMLLNSI